MKWTESALNKWRDKAARISALGIGVGAEGKVRYPQFNHKPCKPIGIYCNRIETGKRLSSERALRIVFLFLY
jgi:hypothetical protein